jgi:hypothetical protein
VSGRVFWDVAESVTASNVVFMGPYDCSHIPTGHTTGHRGFDASKRESIGSDLKGNMSGAVAHVLLCSDRSQST